MKKHTKLGLLGLAAGVGAAGGLAAMGNLLYNHIMVPVPRDPAKDATNPLLQQGGPQVGQGGGRLPVRGHPVGGWPAAVGRSGPR